MHLRSLDIWKQAIRFHITNWRKLLPILPLLVIPVISDALHSLLIKQEIERGELLPFQAFKQVWRLIPSLLGMKLYFEFAAVLWIFIPIYGIIKGIKYRMYWAMGSNVLVFEDLSGKAGRERCRELVKRFRGGIGARTLITVPGLLITVSLLLWVVNASFSETSAAYGFLAVIMIYFWITIPASAAVNTFFYIEVKESEK